MDPSKSPKKLFHAVVVLGMVSVSSTGCFASSAPPASDAGGSGSDANKPGNDGSVADAGAVDSAVDPDAFAGWAPCH